MTKTKNHQPLPPNPPISQSRYLWKDPDEGSRKKAQNKDEQEETYESILNQFCTQPVSSSYQSLATLCSNTLVVGQEFALTSLFLARHRVVMWQEYTDNNNDNTSTIQSTLNNDAIDQSQFLSMITLVIIALYSNSSATPPQPQPRKAKIQQRSSDAILLAILLRLLSAILRTLTASFSSDTVQSLTVGGMLVHWLSCDYSYANGKNRATTTTSTYVEEQQSQNENQKGHDDDEQTTIHYYFLSSSSSRRPTFRGGTISLNAAFFSTTLLASRLSSNATVYVFVSSAIIIFGFYPASRHAISHHPHHTLVHMGVTCMLSISTCLLLQDWTECLWFGSILVIICGIAPLWKWHLQRYKRRIDGPWDVVPVSQMMLDY